MQTLSEPQKKLLNKPAVQDLVKALDLVPVMSEPSLQDNKIAARVSDWFLEFDHALVYQAQKTRGVTG